MEAYKLLFLIVFPIGVTVFLTNPNVIPKLVNYYNYVQYPKQVDVTQEQMERNTDFSKLFQKNFDEEVRKLQQQQQEQEQEQQQQPMGAQPQQQQQQQRGV